MEYITNGCLDSFSAEEIDLMTAMSVTARRPLNWNVLTVDARSAQRIEHQLSASSAAAAAGGRIVALTSPRSSMDMSFRTHCALFLIPGWGDVMGLPEAERMEQLADPSVRTLLDGRARSKEAGVFRGLSHWGTYVIGDTYAAANDGSAFRTVADIAAERGTAPFDTLLDIVLADQLRTVLWPNTDDGDEATWDMRAAIWSDPRAMVGGSDAGAHLDRMCGSNYPTAFLGDCLRGRKLVPVERAVHMMTAQPAELFGLRARPGPRGIRRRSLRLRPRDRGLGAGPPGARPPRRHTAALRRLPRGRTRPGQRGRDHPRRGSDRALPGTLLRSAATPRPWCPPPPEPGHPRRRLAFPPVTPDPNDPALAVEEPPMGGTPGAGAPPDQPARPRRTHGGSGRRSSSWWSPCWWPCSCGPSSSRPSSSRPAPWSRHSRSATASWSTS